MEYDFGDGPVPAHKHHYPESKPHYE
jgi:hypothetical protein